MISIQHYNTIQRNSPKSISTVTFLFTTFILTVLSAEIQKHHMFNLDYSENSYSLGVK